MVLARSAVLRAAAQQLARPSLRSAARRQPWQRLSQSVSRRGYSSSHGGSDHGKAKSDLPWMIGSVAVGVPGTWWMLQPGEHHDSHGEHHEEHHEKHEEPKQEEAPKEEPKQEEEPEEEPKAESEDEPKEEKDESKDESKEKDEPKEPKKEGSKDKSSGPRAKGATSKGEGEGAPDTRRSMDDSKEGAGKRRIDSDYRKELGKDESQDKSASGSSKDKPAPNKEPLSQNQTSGKQEGLSNTDTRHSTDPTADGKSKKPEGGPETAKSKGTIDPNRPAK